MSTPIQRGRMVDLPGTATSAVGDASEFSLKVKAL